MTEYVLSIDCGMSTGIALLSFEPDEPAQLVQGWQFSGGVVGLTKWLSKYWDGDFWDYYNDQENLRGFRGWEMGAGGMLTVDTQEVWDAEQNESAVLPPNLVVIAEKFTARNTRGFSYTTASLEPLRGEGALIALGVMPDYDVKEKRWRDPKMQYLVGGKEEVAKIRQHAFLKDVGFYRTNKDFPESPSKNKADDFRSACAHGLAYIAREVGHRPTFDMIADWTERNPA